MKVLLLQLDGKHPNHALMRVSTLRKSMGDEVTLRRVVSVDGMDALAVRFDGADSYLDQFDLVFASLIFSKTGPVAARLLEARPDAYVGGSGWDDYPRERTRVTTLEEVGIFTRELDYSHYPNFTASIGYTQRGCRMGEKTCGHFCGVPRREGKVRPYRTVADIWRGEPYPKHLLLLDNDFFGNPGWRSEIEAIREGGFKVCWNQGINARTLTDETAAAIASVQYYDDDFETRRVYTAWDSNGDERVLMRGLEALKRHGIEPDQIMVYMLLTYHGGQTAKEWEYRREKLREFGARPYPMPKERTTEQVGYQRYVLGAYDKRRLVKEQVLASLAPEGIADKLAAGEFERDEDGRLWWRARSWREWKAARFQPGNLARRDEALLFA